jgi:hypothetical protein
MRIKLIEAGWDTYSDVLCAVPFVNGVSVRDVSRIEADRISSILRVETLEGDAVGSAARMTDLNNVSAEELGFKHYGSIDKANPVLDEAVNAKPKLAELPEPAPVATKSEEDVMLVDDDADQGDAAPEVPVAPVVAEVATQAETPAAAVEVEVKAKVWTEEELAAVADKSGIDGLREIGTPMGVKARSIREMIDGIVAAQAK